MAPAQDETGCDAFAASVSFDAGQIGTIFQWGVVADIAGAPNTWVVVTEVPDENSDQRYRSFALGEGNLRQDYWLVIGRRFGAQKYFPPGVAARPAIRFSVWAPHARNVEVVFAAFDLSTGPLPATSPMTAPASTRPPRWSRCDRREAFGKPTSQPRPHWRTSMTI